MVFNLGLSKRSPYVSQLRPDVTELGVGVAKIGVCKRKAVHNHLSAIDSNALFTLAQLTVGLSIETVIPKDKKWIPVGAKIEYLKLAESDVLAICDCTYLDFEQSILDVPVLVVDKLGDAVQKAVIQVSVRSK